MRLGIILSNDWELFGDGSGDYWEIQRNRLKEMLDAADTVGAPLTVMAEMGQQWAHQKIGQREAWAQEIADDWEATVIETMQRGSDVQLHYHTQWRGAQWSSGRWQLQVDRLAFSALPTSDMTEVLCNGKRYLESLLKPVQPTYRTVMFRAGAFYIEPAAQPLEALRAAGFVADSSVIKGLIEPPHFDYRRAPSHAVPWEVCRSSVSRAGKSGTVEVPIYSTRVWDFPILRKLGWRYYTRAIDQIDRDYQDRRARYQAQTYPSVQHIFGKKRPGPIQRIGRFLKMLVRPMHAVLDYDNLPAAVFVDLVERLLNSRELKCPDLADAVVPVMALGHAKTIPDVENFYRVIHGLVERLGDHVTFWTGQQAAEYWAERLGVEVPVQNNLASCAA